MSFHTRNEIYISRLLPSFTMHSPVISACSQWFLGKLRAKLKMEKLTTQLFYCFFFIALIVLQSPPATSQEVGEWLSYMIWCVLIWDRNLILSFTYGFVYGAEDETEFNYEKGSEHGPERWGELHSEWSDCKNGTMQSPIDLLHERVEVVSHLGRLKRSYKLSNATLRNRGHDMMVINWNKRKKRKILNFYTLLNKGEMNNMIYIATII